LRQVIMRDTDPRCRPRELMRSRGRRTLSELVIRSRALISFLFKRI
jgi:hypothetical protein